MTGRLLAVLPLGCTTLLLAAGGAPFYWPLGFAMLALKWTAFQPT